MAAYEKESPRGLSLQNILKPPCGKEGQYLIDKFITYHQTRKDREEYDKQRDRYSCGKLYHGIFTLKAYALNAPADHQYQDFRTDEVLIDEHGSCNEYPGQEHAHIKDNKQRRCDIFLFNCHVNVMEERCKADVTHKGIYEGCDDLHLVSEDCSRIQKRDPVKRPAVPGRCEGMLCIDMTVIIQHMSAVRDRMLDQVLLGIYPDKRHIRKYINDRGQYDKASDTDQDKLNDLGRLGLAADLSYHPDEKNKGKSRCGIKRSPLGRNSECKCSSGEDQMSVFFLTDKCNASVEHAQYEECNDDIDG